MSKAHDVPSCPAGPAVSAADKRAWQKNKIPKRQTQASHQAGYPKIASKVLDALIGPQIEGTKIKDRLEHQHRAQRHFWVAVGAII